MTEELTAAQLIRVLWDRIDAQRWDGLAEVLDPDARIELVHTGEVLTRDAFLRLNGDYPGRWHASVEDLVADADRAVTRARVTDGERTFHVASFARSRSGLLVELVEVWTESGQTPPPEARAGGA